MAEIGIDLHKAATLLQQGFPLAIPTETVYGLAANALDENAVKKIYTVKNRPLNNPLILHIGNKTDIEKYTLNIPEIAYQLIDKFWPGPLTLLLPKKNNVPEIITHGMHRVAVRMPNHPLTLKLLNLLPFPLAAPSANPSGYISPTNVNHVQQQIGDKIPYILDGGSCTQGIESTIIGFENNETIVYRLGALPLEDIETITGSVSFYIKDENSPQAPGMLLKHYAPHTTFVVTDTIKNEQKKHTGKRIGLIVFKNIINHEIPKAQLEVLSEKEDIKEAATGLYAAMHRLDAMGLDIIIAEKFPEIGIGRAINDRLMRASVL